MFETRRIVTFPDTDAAGAVFFAHYFFFAHEAYERFLDRIGFAIAGILRERTFLLPIVHARCDYFSFVTVGDVLAIALMVTDLGTSSFTLSYDFALEHGKPAACLQTVHACVDKATAKKIPIPQGLRKALQAHLPSVS